MQSKINPRAAKTLRSALHPYSAFFASIIAFAVIPSVTAPGMTANLTPLLTSEKTDHAKSRACSCKKYEEEEKMIEKGLIITGSDAELLSRALSEVKTKAYEESEAQLDDTQALNALVSGFMSARNGGHEKEKLHAHFNPLRKRLVLGTIIDRQIGVDSRKA